jgi:hypothetical protein
MKKVKKSTGPGLIGFVSYARSTVQDHTFSAVDLSFWSVPGKLKGVGGLGGEHML